MNMVVINLGGQAVTEFASWDSFVDGVKGLLSQKHSDGIGAIIVKDRTEAALFLRTFRSNNHQINNIVGKHSPLDSEKWNLISIEQSRGLEFDSVIAVSQNMTINQKYVAYTRALNKLYVMDRNIEWKDKKATDASHLNSSRKQDAYDVSMPQKMALNVADKTENTDSTTVKKTDSIELKKASIDVFVHGINSGKYRLIPFKGKLKRITSEPTVGMFIPQIRNGKERLVPVSVDSNNMIIYIEIDNYKTYGKGLKSSSGIELRKS